VATYNDLVPAFRALLRREKTWTGFYKAVNRLAALDKKERTRVLTGLATTGATGLQVVQRTMSALP